MTANEAMRAAELAEAAYLETMYDAASDDVRAALGMAHARIGSGLVCVMEHDPTGFWSRAVGFGVDEPVTPQVLEDMIGFAREHHAPVLCVQVAPQASPAGWEDLLREHGLTPSASWVKFVAPGGFSIEADTDLDIEQIGPDLGRHFARVMCEGFGMPLDSPLPDWFARMPGADGLTTYAAFDGNEVLATAVLSVRGDLASLCGAATLPAGRGRGAQSALMARRLDDASALGVAWIGTETGTETPEQPNPSLHNMRRLGFTELYERRNWTWRP